ncbi:uncharacterized protein [Blastocystis hominis]|uniref:Uncharacterized protein n=1 Tax=Blastocystis hominis TaxID=12968 RepID=D8LX40_BLAHO|nr:uncharacterized protein [Blastocystis hominis]CBK20835.2 unnamed protein product [Blastocystis hominis]|eukprot:XP_012894883.1 uncharacterized protein [Blastocystis hominis]
MGICFVWNTYLLEMFWTPSGTRCASELCSLRGDGFLVRCRDQVHEGWRKSTSFRFF